MNEWHITRKSLDICDASISLSSLVSFMQGSDETYRFTHSVFDNII